MLACATVRECPLKDVRPDLAADEFSVVSESLRRTHTNQGGSMRFVLLALGDTSNASIHGALVERARLRQRPGMTR
jgi:hypothetical protein